MLNLFRLAFNKTETNSEQEKRKIILNVYDMLQPSFISNLGHVLGVGIYHSGIEIDNQEYCFGGHDYEHLTGVFMVRPKVGPQGLLFKQSITIGYTNLTQDQVGKVLKDMSKEYVGTSYNLLMRNCNHFSDELAKRLTGKSIPGWVNRAAKLGTMFPCVIPTEWVEPPDANDLDATTTTTSTATNSPTSECSSNTPLNKKQSKTTTTVITTNTNTKQKTDPRQSATPSTPRRTSGSTESIRLVRAPKLEDDEIDCSSPVKEPDTHRPEVIRSATQLSMTATAGL